ESGSPILDPARRGFVDNDQKVSELALLRFAALIDESDFWRLVAEHAVQRYLESEGPQNRPPLCNDAWHGDQGNRRDCGRLVAGCQNRRRIAFLQGRCNERPSGVDQVLLQAWRCEHDRSLRSDLFLKLARHTSAGAAPHRGSVISPPISVPV